jgi:hypothetical protein
MQIPSLQYRILALEISLHSLLNLAVTEQTAKLMVEEWARGQSGGRFSLAF